MDEMEKIRIFRRIVEDFGGPLAQKVPEDSLKEAVWYACQFWNADVLEYRVREELEDASTFIYDEMVRSVHVHVGSWKENEKRKEEERWNENKDQRFRDNVEEALVPLRRICDEQKSCVGCPLAYEKNCTMRLVENCERFYKKGDC